MHQNTCPTYYCTISVRNSSLILSLKNLTVQFSVSLQYEPRLVLGKPPSTRGYHATILADSRLFVFGGFNGHIAFDDVYILDLAAGAYLPQVTSFTMEAI
jgi:hypothetical protein